MMTGPYPNNVYTIENRVSIPPPRSISNIPCKYEYIVKYDIAAIKRRTLTFLLLSIIDKFLKSGDRYRIYLFPSFQDADSLFR